MTEAKLIQWALRPADHLLLQVPRALVSSGLAAGLDFGILVALVQFTGWNPLLAATASYLLGGLLQYVLCSVWVFPMAPENVTGGMVVFILLSLGGLGITWVTMGLFNQCCQINYHVAKLLALGFAFSWNFTSRKYWLFSQVRTSVLPQPE
jgi:putative flippase GtrA